MDQLHPPEHIGRVDTHTGNVLFFWDKVSCLKGENVGGRGKIVEASDVAEIEIPISAHSWVFADGASMTRVRELLGHATKNRQEFV